MLFTDTLLMLLAEGKPVSAKQVACRLDVTDAEITEAEITEAEITEAFGMLRKGGVRIR